MHRAMCVLLTLFSGCDGDANSFAPIPGVDPASLSSHGIVVVTVLPDGDAGLYVGAGFYALAKCRPKLVAGCYVDDCSHAESVSVGDIDGGTVTVTSRSIGSVELRTATKSPVSVDLVGRKLQEAEAVSFSSTGGDTPAFHVTLTAPSEPTDVVLGGCRYGEPRCSLDLDTHPFARWSPMRNGDFKVGFRIDGEGRAINVQCLYKGSDGAGRLPNAVRSLLPKIESFGIGHFAVSRTTIQSPGHVTEVVVERWHAGPLIVGGP